MIYLSNESHNDPSKPVIDEDKHVHLQWMKYLFDFEQQDCLLNNVWYYAVEQVPRIEMQLLGGCGREGNNNCKMSGEWNFFSCGDSDRNMETDHTHGNPLMFWHVWKERTENVCFNHNVFHIEGRQAIGISQCRHTSHEGKLTFFFSYNWLVFRRSNTGYKILLCLLAISP